MTCRKVFLGDEISDILNEFFPTYYTTMSKEDRVKTLKVVINMTNKEKEKKDE